MDYRQDVSFDVTGLGELEKALEAASKKFPYSAEKTLKQEIRITAKDLKAETKREIKKHGKKPHSLERSFSVGKVIKSGKKYVCAVTTKAPHYHLVEEGHEASGWYEASGEYVPAKKIVAKYMAERSEHAEEMAQKLLDEILKHAGFL